MDVVRLRKYETLSPFEIKNDLAAVATSAARASQVAYLNAGRGNPNWIATEPRSGFFLLGQFAVTESQRTMDLPGGVGGMPKAAGVAERLAAWLSAHADRPGATFLQHVIPWAIRKFEFNADAFVHELVDSIIGDNYPVPDRMLVHNERIVREYLQWAMCGEPRPAGTFALYAVEGGTAAMCYLFKSLKANRLLNPGDTIALVTPVFTPYLEISHLEDYDLKMVFIQARQEQRWQFSDSDLAPLLDPAVKAFFVVNPGNPYAVALSRETIAAIGRVLEKRPDLMLLTDDVYGTFVSGFRSLLGEFPKNTIGVYSYSKYFGCTGWRLGVIALHEENVFDEKIAAHTDAVARALDKRYAPLTLEPRTLKFIDRIVADSRDVALNHTAGLSLPQQVMMTLFSLAELYDDKKVYQQACIDIVRKRVTATIEGLGIHLDPNPLFDWYYGLIDFEFWLRKYGGEDVVQWVKANVHPLDIVFRLAEDHGIVLLNGGGFEAPDWSVRVSFANLDEEVYEQIGRAVRAVARGYVMAFQAAGAHALRSVHRSHVVEPPMIQMLTGILRGASRGDVLPRARDRLRARQAEARQLHAGSGDGHAPGRRRHRTTGRAGVGRGQAVLLSPVPVLDRVQDRTAVLPRPEERRPAAGGARGDRRDDRPRRRLRGQPDVRVRRRDGGGRDRGRVDRVCDDRHRERRHRPARPACRRRVGDDRTGFPSPLP